LVKLHSIGKDIKVRCAINGVMTPPGPSECNQSIGLSSIDHSLLLTRHKIAIASDLEFRRAASKVMTVAEASEYLRIPKSSLYKLAQDGRIPCQTVGRHWRFLKAALDQWLGLEEDSRSDQDIALP
jgi:excisionase family DNA binding protein